MIVYGNVCGKVGAYMSSAGGKLLNLCLETKMNVRSIFFKQIYLVKGYTLLDINIFLLARVEFTMIIYCGRTDMFEKMSCYG